MTPPPPDELELSLFGPGVGECAVVHLGGGEWMVVDSCTPGGHDVPIALTYLESLGVDVRSQVVLIVVTHWHDDHIGGMSKVLKRAERAKFVCSAALHSEEFLTLVAGDREVILVEQSSGVREFFSILEVLEGRANARGAWGPDQWAAEGMCLYQRGGLYPIKVSALSPSAQTITDGHRSLADEVPKAGEAIRRFRHPNPNDLSVVLKISTPSIQFLLGGDLEVSGSTRHGWRAVLASQTVPEGRSAVFKVAHHGSKNADFPQIWQDLLVTQPYAVLSPYAKLRNPLPTDADVTRMKEYTDHLYCTTWPPTKRPKPRNSAVTRTMQETIRSNWAVPDTMGQIRLRVPHDGDHANVGVELINGAKQL